MVDKWSTSAGRANAEDGRKPFADTQLHSTQFAQINQPRLQTKLSALKTNIFSRKLYACETWVLTKDCVRRILAFERKCDRKITGIGWSQKVMNKELYAKVTQRNLLQEVIRRKLQLSGMQNE